MEYIIKKFILIFLLFAIVGKGNSQQINKKDFNDTDWFVNNENDNFYKSDTITMVKIIKYNTYQDELNSLYIKLKYNNHKDLTQITLKKNGLAEIVNLHVQSWTDSRFNFKWEWKFSPKKNDFSLYNKHELYSKFRIFSIEKDTIISDYGYSGNGTKSKLDLLVLKMKRQN